MGDYWDCKDPKPIHVKEADTVLKTLVSLVRRIGDSRVDLRTDNMTVLRVWENGGGKDPWLTSSMKSIFYHICNVNVVRLSYVPSISKNNIVLEQRYK